MRYLILIGALILTLQSFSQNKDLEAFKKALNKSNIKHKNIVLKQAILETGWFTSRIYRDNMNCFGFYYNGFIKFRSIEKCIGYYERWQSRHYEGGDYYEFLNCLYKDNKGDCIGYAKDSNYTKKLKKIVVNIN